ncbi:MAG: efflux RND transporter permease subunit [Gammaproteobacteria bacterium]
MDTFFRFFAERQLLAFIITLTILLLGAGTLTTIKRDSYPDIEFGELLITTTYPGASPEDVELNVTNEIEEELQEVTGIKYYQSWSQENVSTVYVVLDPDEDQDEVEREVREAVSRVTDLPSEVTESPLVTEMGTEVFPIIEVGVAGDLPYKDLREIARRFEKKLEDIDGVAKVERFGYRDREVRIEVDPDVLVEREVSLIDVINAIAGRNVRGTGGSLESYTSERNIVTLAQFREPLEVKGAIVRKTFDRPPVLVSDLATVTDTFEDEKVRSRLNGEAAISFIAYKKKSADIIRTVSLIRDLVEREQQYLPEGVELLVSNDESKLVKGRFDIVMNNGLIGLALVTLVLATFLNLRIAFWVALGIPVAIFGVIFLLPLFDSFLDTVTMTAMVLVIGIIVDDAIIVAENIYRYAEQGLSPVDAAVKGVTSVFKPVLTTIATTVVVFSPLFVFPGMLGDFVRFIPLVVSLALAISLIECTLALPAHLVPGLSARAWKTKATRPPVRERLFAWLRKKYAGFLDRLLILRYLLLVVFTSILFYALWYASQTMAFSMFPSSTAERFVINLRTPVGMSLEATSDKVAEIEAIIAELADDELDSFVARIGTFGEVGSSEQENHAALFVNLTPFSQRDRTADDIVAAMRARTETLDGIDQLNYIIDAGGPPVGRPIYVRIIGTDDEMRDRLAGDIEAYLKTVPGARDIDRSDPEGKRQLEIKLDYEELAQAGITAADVARNVRIAYDGEVVTNVRYGDEDVDFRVIFPERLRADPDMLNDIVIPNSGGPGRLTRLGRVARFENNPGPATLGHYKGDRSITISGDIDQNVTTALQVSQGVLDKFNVDRDYPGMRIDIGGEAEESVKSLQELYVTLTVASIGVYFLLILLFNSLWQPLLVMIAIPFGLVGVIVGFSVHDVPLGFLAMTGVVGMIGVVVNDSLVLVNHVNELQKNYPEQSFRSIVAQGAADRLRAIVLTTVSTVAGLLPLAYGFGGADPYMGPMALALGWGLLFATPLTLLLVPSVFMIGDDFRRMGAWVVAKVSRQEA